MGSMLSGGFVAGNRIQPLNNGDEIFPAMLAAIRGARRSINFETFIFYDGELPQSFADALAAAARRGVRVNLIFDAVGASRSRRYHAALRDAGAELNVYHPILWLDPRRANHRTHRKLLIVDGRVGFTGGVGIGHEWEGRASSPEEWRDVHFRVEGPVVAQLQAAFQDNWLKTGGTVLQGSGYFPPLAPVGSAAAAMFYTSPRAGQTGVEVMYHHAIASARESLLIENAYFVPDRSLVEALVAAAQRGVKVQILMPGEHIDQKAVRRASKKRWPELLRAGVELYEYGPTMIHSKLLIADGRFVSVGSANFDPRSLRINDEANLNVLDTNFAGEMTRIFRADLRHAERVTREDAGSPAEKPVQVAQTPLEPQL
jgi:cardiolipin synthase